MKKQNPFSEELIAPCGMNCAICSRYLAKINNLKRSQCIGCRPRNQRCTYLFKNCGGPGNGSRGIAAFCFECNKYPCKQIDRMDKRYRIGYGMSIKDNLEYIRKKGVDKFIEAQYKRYHCPRCFGLISVHNRKCFRCEPIKRLVDKQNPDVKGISGGNTPQKKEPSTRKQHLTTSAVMRNAARRRRAE